MKIYLDIDGVLLTKAGVQAEHVKSFLEVATTAHQVYWLTTHCKGDAEDTINQISGSFDPDILPLLKKIKPTNWTTLKTEALDFSSDFLWFDDYVMQVEQDILRKHGKLDSLIVVDLINDPEYLKAAIKILK